jgi:hypothetical protein
MQIIQFGAIKNLVQTNCMTKRGMQMMSLNALDVETMEQPEIHNSRKF